MNAEIITIGDEILIGQIVDTNSAFIAKKLNKIGIDVAQITSIQDGRYLINSPKHRRCYFKSRSGHFNRWFWSYKRRYYQKYFFKYFHDKMVQHQEVLIHIEELFERSDTTNFRDES